MTSLYLNTLTSGMATVSVSETTGSVTGPTQAATVVFNAQLTATNAPNLTLNASPSVVAPNTNAADPTAQFSVLTATVRDGTTYNNLVAGVPVAFSVVTDSSGGYVYPPVVVTQANGQAQANYYPGQVSTPQDGVDITATLENYTTKVVKTPISLTVGSQALFVTLGTGNTLTAPDATTYQQLWAVYVTDAAGQPVQNATVTATLEATTYTKGVMIFTSSTGWIIGSGQPTDGVNGSIWCPNTDPTGSGVWSVTDPIQIFYPYPSALDPASVTNNHTDYPVVMPGIPGNVTSGVATDANGYALLTVTYPKDHSYWTNVSLVATAATLGTQSSSQANFQLLGLAADYASSEIAPPGKTSPYGVNNCETAF